MDVETPFQDQKKKVPAVKVVDVTTGNVISEVDLPVNWAFASKVLWLREPEALCLADGKARRINYLKGELMNQTNFDISSQNILFNGNAEVDDDGQTLYSISGGYKSSRVELDKSDITMWESAKLGEAELPSLTGNARGLVPGGKYFFVGDPGLYIYDRNSVKLEAQKRLNGWDLLHISFSSQGSYCAIAAGARRIVGDNFAVYEPDVHTIIRVQETLAGKTVFAFPAHSRWVSDIKFSPNAERLAVVTDDGFIEIWDTGFAKP
jgi:WD40 repeat protein